MKMDNTINNELSQSVLKKRVSVDCPSLEAGLARIVHNTRRESAPKTECTFDEAVEQTGIKQSNERKKLNKPFWQALVSFTLLCC